MFTWFVCVSAETTERESANETSSVGDLQPAADVDHHPENRVPPLVNHE